MTVSQSPAAAEGVPPPVSILALAAELGPVARLAMEEENKTKSEEAVAHQRLCALREVIEASSPTSDGDVAAMLLSAYSLAGNIATFLRHPEDADLVREHSQRIVTALGNVLPYLITRAGVTLEQIGGDLLGSEDLRTAVERERARHGCRNDAALVARCLRWQADHARHSKDWSAHVTPLYERWSRTHSCRGDRRRDTPEQRAYDEAYDLRIPESERLIAEFAAIIGTPPATIAGATAKAYLCAYTFAAEGVDSAYGPTTEEWWQILATDLARLVESGAIPRAA